MFDFIETELPGCFDIQPVVRADSRGNFIKTFHENAFAEAGLATDFKEQYVSTSSKGVVRGLHFQTPPHHHEKLVGCIVGEIYDIAVDIRKGSPTFGKHISRILSAQKGNHLYLPKGFAHGFQALSGEAVVYYNVGTLYNPEHEGGILWDSVGANWPIPGVMLSDRDLNLPTFDEFDSPFSYTE